MPAIVLKQIPQTSIIWKFMEFVWQGVLASTGQYSGQEAGWKFFKLLIYKDYQQVSNRPLFLGDVVALAESRCGRFHSVFITEIRSAVRSELS